MAQTLTVMGEWLEEAIRSMRMRSKTAPLQLSGGSDGWTLRLSAALPQRAPAERQCEVGTLIPATVTQADLQIAVRGNAGIAPGPQELVIDAAGVHDASGLLFARAPDAAASRIDPLAQEADLGEVARAQFIRAAERVAPAAVRHMHRPVLEGVSLQAARGGWVMVATDSYVLRMAPLGGDLEGAPIVTSRAWVERLARELQREKSDLPVRLTRVTGGIVGWINEERYVAGPLIDGDYPHAEMLFPVNIDARWTCDRDALDVALAALGDGTDPMVMTYEGSSLVFASDGRRSTVDVADDQSPIIATGLNRAFLRRIVAGLDPGPVWLSHAGNLRPLTIAQDDLQILQMPIRLPEEHV